ncbi:acyl--CoA ligase [Mycobacterium koreense]|uniref:Cyclohexanecarboxylate-CoA ligase n=1 Tax=Mycolicibacillus koreensis TaxID=1069220 RepID=A0A7I7SA82_9MYCO|nr:class I adenylate-forming enzyme family protein [Mycolicibacillus koreensis]MCV7249287.1 acyl--CoA ligase [Mycolicibacillus koreensis]OSC35564.1 cyclohexanecarboxylate-CoA ligase [Mycolicibacillus koreensis]BBY53199.1 AMP-dependent synthetase [Mycolicibacillus koreensis]
MAVDGGAAARSPAFTAAEITRYHRAGWWSTTTLSAAVRRNAERTADRVAYRDHGGAALSWAQFDAAAEALARQLVGAGVRPGDRVAVWHADTVGVHVLFVAIERVAAVVVGLGVRAGPRELTAILAETAPAFLVTDPPRAQAAVPVAAAAGTRSLVVRDLRIAAPSLPLPPPLGADDVFLINSTSGTTGLPKCVVHTQNRWYYFHQKAVANADLRAEDVFLPVIPTPFGFGLWTSHTTPIHLGARTVLLDRFSAAATWAAIAEHPVSVLCCVSTQLTMMMADPARGDHDLSSLRVVFTGGEALPFHPAAAFEDLTGATILQFYGSNETGLLSGTTVADPRQRRLATAGRVVPEMAVRLFDGDDDVTATGTGQPACRGPATSLGYLGGVDHDALFTADGWMRMGDVCHLDGEGYLTVTGRSSDFIVRGGKNISAAQVEDAASAHPAVAVAAAVAMPDPVFGEKVCLYVERVEPVERAEPVEGTEVGEYADPLDLERLNAFLLSAGASKEMLPERLIVMAQLPRSSGGKIAKGVLREDIRSRTAPR